MYWAAEASQGSSSGRGKARSRNDHPHWLEARVEGDGPQSEKVVVEMGSGIRMFISNRRQAALAGEVLRAIGLGRGC
jgi:hypothetical protein